MAHGARSYARSGRSAPPATRSSLARRVPVRVTPGSLHLRSALRSFALGAFARLAQDLERSGEALPFAFEEHHHRGGPALYEYRPLVGGFVEAHAAALRDTADAELALDELEREPATAVYAHAHSGWGPTGRDGLFRIVLLDLVVRVAEACGGLDWNDSAFDRAYAALEQSLFGAQRSYRAVTPLVGLTGLRTQEFGDGMRVRVVAEGEMARHWPEARTLLPTGLGREPDRCLVLEASRLLAADERAPDISAEIADAVSAIRLATAAPLAAGPVSFETLDGRPFGLRPVLPIAAAQPSGEPGRLDEFRGARAARLVPLLALADDDDALGEALDRWELSLTQRDPFRAEQLRASLGALLGAAWPLHAAMLLERETSAQGRLHRSLAAFSEGQGSPEAIDAVRRSLVAVLEHGDRRSLLRELDARSSPALS